MLRTLDMADEQRGIDHADQWSAKGSGHEIAGLDSIEGICHQPRSPWRSDGEANFDTGQGRQIGDIPGHQAARLAAAIQSSQEGGRGRNDIGNHHAGQGKAKVIADGDGVSQYTTGRYQNSSVFGDVWLGDYQLDIGVRTRVDTIVAETVVTNAADEDVLVAIGGCVGQVAVGSAQIIGAGVSAAIIEGPFAKTRVVVGDGSALEFEQNGFPLLRNSLVGLIETAGGQNLRSRHGVARTDDGDIGRAAIDGDFSQTVVFCNSTDDAHVGAQGRGG